MPVKRRFVLGEDWLYMKIYAGLTMQEHILVKDVYEIVELSLKAQHISIFFFVRYSDSDGEHIRLRFKLARHNNLSEFLGIINERLARYVSNRVIHKITYDTYNREIERYGSENIEDVEILFGVDSQLILNGLKYHYDQGDVEDRWLLGAFIMDDILNKFGLSTREKYELYEEYYKLYEKEFGVHKVGKKSLASKYREVRSSIEEVLSDDKVLVNSYVVNSNYSFLSKISEAAVNRILERYRVNGKPSIPMRSLLMSIMHMHYNRLFKSQQRLHELVMYFVMSKVYNSLELKQKSSL